VKQCGKSRYLALATRGGERHRRAWSDARPTYDRPLAHKADLVAYRAFLIEARDHVAKLIKEGKSEQDAVAAHVFADWDAKLNANEQASTNFTRVVYNSLKPPKAK
jgi:hypothetical protein